jgi:hypothetical protein
MAFLSAVRTSVDARRFANGMRQRVKDVASYLKRSPDTRWPIHRIPIERARAEILLMAGGDDAPWQSDERKWDRGSNGLRSWGIFIAGAGAGDSREDADDKANRRGRLT